MVYAILDLLGDVKTIWGLLERVSSFIYTADGAILLWLPTN